MPSRPLIVVLGLSLLAGCGANYAAKCGPDTDPAISDKLLSSACEGDEFAQYEIGQIYENGTGAPVNLERAAEWYKRAAARKSGADPIYLAPVGNQRTGWVMPVARGPTSRGDADAQYRLGLMYLDGRGVKQNRKKARKWLKRAAKQEHRQAARLLERLENETREIGG